MTRNEFLQATIIAFAGNASIVKEEYTPEHCIKVIMELAQRLTVEAETITLFDTRENNGVFKDIYDALYDIKHELNGIYLAVENLDA